MNSFSEINISMITSPLYWNCFRDKGWLEFALICCMEVRLRGCPSNIFTIDLQDPFPICICLKAQLVRKCHKLLGGMFPQRCKKNVFQQNNVCLENPEFLSTHDAAGAMGVQVKLLISVKSDSCLHCFR